MIKNKSVYPTKKVLADRILLKRVDAEMKTPGGLIIPDTAKEPKQKGIVIQVGNQVVEFDLIKEGAIVVFGKYGGSEIEIGKETYIMIKEPEIFAVVLK